MVLMCSVSAISATSDNTVDNLMSEIDSGDDSISLSNNEEAVGVDGEDSTLNAQENNVQSLDEDCSHDLISVENEKQKNNVVNFNERRPSGQTFKDIQNVIDESNDSDVIKLSGTYIGSGKAMSFNNKALTIYGENNATLDARNLGGIINCYIGKPIILANIKFINYSSDSISSVFFADGQTNLTIVNCTFIGNHVASAIHLYGAKCFASDCIFINNSGQYYGGAINSQGSVINCRFINNSAGSGGAINAIKNVTNCIFINNSANFGGAIYSSGSVVNCSFIDNHANQDGAIIEGGATVENCSFVNNTAGGIVYGTSTTGCSFINNSGSRTMIYSDSIINCSFVANTGLISEGSKFIENCSFIENNGTVIFNAESITDCIFIKNGNGYAIIGYKLPSITTCSFINNTAGAINIMGKSHINNCTFINNTADNGGAIRILANDCCLNNCEFINNTADNGGAIYILGDDCCLNNCNFINNTADNGGAIYCVGLNALVNNTLFSNNKLNAVQSEYEIFIENYTLINQTKEDLNLIEVESKINATFSINCSDTYFRFKDIAVTLKDGSGNPISNQRILIELSNGTATRMTTDSEGRIVYKLSGFGIHNLTFSSKSNIYNITKMSLNNIRIEKYDYLTPDGQTTDDIQYILDNSYEGDLIKLHGKYITTKTKLKITNPLIIEGDDSTEFDSEFLGFEIYTNDVTIRNIHSNIHSIIGYGYSNISAINCIFANNYGNSAIQACHNSTVINCSFVNNSAYEGGAISGCKGLKIYNSTFTNNSAEYGGAIHLNGYGGSPGHCTSYVFNCSFIGNSATVQFGAISNVYGDEDWVIVDSLFINNTAGDYGVAYRGYYNNCTFIKNSGFYCGTIYDSNNAVNCSFIANEDVYHLNNGIELSLIKNKFYYKSGETLDVKITITDSKYLTNGLYVAVGEAGDLWDSYSYSRVNGNGIVHLKISTLSVGTYHVIAYLFLDSDSSIGVASSKIKINKAKPSVSAPKITAKYKKSKYFKVTVKYNKKALKNLKIKVKVYTGKKYKTYTLKTDKKGIAKINTKKLKKGTHKVVISSGNSNYYISKKSQIKIK